MPDFLMKPKIDFAFCQIMRNETVRGIKRKRYFASMGKNKAIPYYWIWPLGICYLLPHSISFVYITAITSIYYINNQFSII